jgi:hypothetical protein
MVLVHVCHKKANWEKIETCTDELTKDIVTEGKNINNVVKIFNASIVKGANLYFPHHLVPLCQIL